ncbi:precorrin-2 C(20)-methyltransferase [Acuticoccus sp. MNP-M23]|uniref:precorrin-2 C(20)-methyltransferase n=1 Tax=Acuticoccus sp. MNP-M23 TaxID=3072793 RepID=UPI00281602D3|nr:precorrin-2 C(20)-methyltransferase [Acuticoccus sp. MNP-M23]WMS44310.1 precorrin-2 C(20)-methyltransferase [Acuticoccus sp. MNP-M23]
MTDRGSAPGKLWGVGTGPGDPELLTLKAARVLKEADVVAYFAKRGRKGNARTTVDAALRPGMREMALEYPVTTEMPAASTEYRSAITAFYEESAARVAAALDAGQSVAVLSEGDPLFYGSYMHLHVRLARAYPSEVIPGVTAMSGCWSQAGLPLVQGDEMMAILPGTLAEDALAARLAEVEAAVIMKVGRNLGRIRRALASVGRLHHAVYVERGTMAGSHHVPLADKPDDAAPYFSLVLVPGWGSRIGGDTITYASAAPAAAGETA